MSIPHDLPLAAAAPLMCAGITTYSALMHYGLRSNHKLAVLGLGGLGHLAVKFGLAFGAHVTVISRGTVKRDSAVEDLHAHAYIDSTNPTAMTVACQSFDMIIDTISVAHDINIYLDLLKLDGKLILVGLPAERFQIHAHPFVMKRRILGGSVIGGIRETQEMLDMCARNHITGNVEVISADNINTAFERLQQGESVKYRFVVDMNTL